MKTCYVAGAIGSLPIDEVIKKFKDAEREVRELGYEPVLPTELPHNHDKSYGSYMIEDLKAMLDCDAVFALTCWRKSPGAQEEVRVATFVGKPVYHQKGPAHKIA